MVGQAEAPTAARTRLVGWVGHNQSVLNLIGGAFVGLVVLPVVFSALSRFDARIGGRFSVVDLVWLVLAAVAAFAMLRARATLSVMATSAATRVLAIHPDSGNVLAGAAASAPSTAVDAADRGSAIARGLLDLALLLLIQVTLRAPLVGLLSGQVDNALVDGVYVVVVVVLALVILIRLYRSGHPLAEQLTWLALSQIVPTAGFAATSVSTTFTTRLATVTSRPATGPASSAPSAGPPTPISAAAEAPTLTAEPTVAADALQATLPAPEPTILAGSGNGAPADVAEATIPRLVVEPPPPPEPDATIVSDESDDGSTTVLSPPPTDELRATDYKDDSR
jgi:hypothetical protein